MKRESVNVRKGNEYFIEGFVYRLYRSPDFWGGEGLIIKGYPRFEIESRKNLFEKNYKTKIIFGDLNKNEKEKLINIATTKDLSLSDIEKIAGEIKKSFVMGFGEVKI